ncbi:MAG: glucose-6-phosphate isomerase [Puniceicoccales bacterium]|jgi:glucose-6-phosphate isomerase|nr:glucose-6-phosphate isomerase [Puniceicoccales bacterium]
MERWKYFCDHYFNFKAVGLGIDVSKIDDFDGVFAKIDRKAIFKEMATLESGAIANSDENRMVGHYWLRNPAIAPSDDLKRAITDVWSNLDRFVYAVHSGDICGQSGKFKNVLCIGIGGSALGPQLACKALSQKPRNKMALAFLDNTDPDGIDYILGKLNGKLDETLVIVTSKSGGTPETRNGMLEVANAYGQAGLVFSRHAIAITCEDSQLDRQAKKEGWLKRFPMWDWVGGRTSIASVVGLLPMALQGIDYKKFLNGMRDVDSLTRVHEKTNPALLLATAWYAATKGKGEKAMVVLPYKDRLALFSKFLQQLIMESLGKKLDRDGKVVEQGLTVYGNKGSTDQHAYVQQLRDGPNNFFVTFIEVLEDRDGQSMDIEEDITAGDYLEGFLLGTRQALYENHRESLAITIDRVDEHHLGVLIGLYERAVSFYASMVNINAYHQPGVEAGKKAANTILKLQKSILQHLRNNPKQSFSAEAIAKATESGDVETVFKLLEHLEGNRRIQCTRGSNLQQNSYQYLI